MNLQKLEALNIEIESLEKETYTLLGYSGLELFVRTATKDLKAQFKVFRDEIKNADGAKREVAANRIKQQRISHFRYWMQRLIVTLGWFLIPSHLNFKMLRQGPIKVNIRFDNKI